MDRPKDLLSQSCACVLLLVLLPVLAQGQEPSSTGRIEVDGGQLYYRLYGQEGSPILLAHGFTHAGQVWEPMIPQLGGDNMLVVPDLRGHGLSSNPSGEFTHRLAAADLLGLLNYLKLESVVAVGHSSGAVALLDLALMAPERISGLVFVGGSHRFSDEVRDGYTQVSTDVWMENLPDYMGAILSWHPDGMAQMRWFAERVRGFATDAEEGAYDPDVLRQLTVPTLIAHGDRDDVFPVELALELHELLPRSELWVMPDVNHAAFVSHWVHPGDVDCGGCEQAAQHFPEVFFDFLRRIR